MAITTYSRRILDTVEQMLAKGIPTSDIVTKLAADHPTMCKSIAKRYIEIAKAQVTSDQWGKMSSAWQDPARSFSKWLAGRK